MTRIAFIDSGRAYLPEIPAYIDYLERRPDVETAVVRSADASWRPSDFDVVWHFMGLDRRGEGRCVVHEYNSLSVGSFARVKDRLKRALNATPDLRVFNSELVEAGFGFDDGVPSRIRVPGVGGAFFGPPLEPRYDFVYVGSMGRHRGFRRFLSAFRERMPDSTLLLVGSAGADLEREFGDATNIVFTGPVSYAEVAELVRQCRYGINYMRPVYPFDRQVAIKLIEYCAAGLRIVSSRYLWAERFVTERAGVVYWLDDDMSNLSREAIEASEYVTPDVSDLEWPRVIEASGIFDVLDDRTPLERR